MLQVHRAVYVQALLVQAPLLGGVCREAAAARCDLEIADDHSGQEDIATKPEHLLTRILLTAVPRI